MKARSSKRPAGRKSGLRMSATQPRNHVIVVNSLGTIETRVAKAIEESPYKWRTISGIAKDAHVNPLQVAELVETSEKFVKASRANASGKALYTTKERFGKNRGFSTRLLSAIINRPIEIE